MNYIKYRDMILINKEIMKINGLPFDLNTFLLDFDYILKTYREKEIYEILLQILNILRGVDSRGFLNTLNLRLFPIIKYLIDDFIKAKENGRDEEFINGSRSSTTYRWLFAILMLNFYTLTLLLKEKMENNNQKSSDLYGDIEYISRSIYDSLEPSVRKSLMKKGISITQNINTALDTEYKNYRY